MGNVLLNLLALCGLQLLSASAWAALAIFNPSGVNAEFVDKVATAHVEVYSPASLEKNLQAVVGSRTKLDLDLGPILAQALANSQIRMTYQHGDVVRTKALSPLPDNKLRRLLANDEIRALLPPYLRLIKRYRHQVSTLFVADEPYLHGISKAELERVSLTLRTMLAEHHIRGVKLGVIFASGMADTSFAKLLDSEAAQYAAEIDEHLQVVDEKIQLNTATADERQWFSNIGEQRLTTYDNAGNMYVRGGLPKGYDLYGFDFHLSTVLQDRLYENMLGELKKHVRGNECDFGTVQTMSELRTRLSFYQDGPVVTSDEGNVDQPRNADRQLLDQLYLCRMTAATQILRQEIAKIGGKGRIVLVTESSNNGVLEFDANQAVEPDQPQLLIQGRVLDEVKRGLAFYNLQRERGDIQTLEFFTFDRTTDHSIQLSVGGFSDMPGVKDLIFSTSQGLLCRSNRFLWFRCP